MLCLNLDDLVLICSLRDQIFPEDNAVLFCAGRHVVEIYEAHLPHFKIVEVEYTRSLKILARLSKFASKLGSEFQNTDPGFGVFTNPVSDIPLRLFRKFNPNKKLIVRFHDQIDPTYRSELKTMLAALQEENIVDEVESYQKSDADYLQCTYRPNGVNPVTIRSAKSNFRDSLMSFSGSPSLKPGVDRLADLRKILHHISLLYPCSSSWISLSDNSNYKISNSWQPYYRWLRKSALSEVCVDLYRVDLNEGFSYRIPEALWLNQKIITNRLFLIECEFYSPERFFILGIDSISRLKGFLEADLSPLPKELLEKFNSALWWTDKDPYLQNF